MAITCQHLSLHHIESRNVKNWSQNVKNKSKMSKYLINFNSKSKILNQNKFFLFKCVNILVPILLT